MKYVSYYAATPTTVQLWQFPSKEEEQHTFRTTPREHW